jgi:hypothetical protein
MFGFGSDSLIYPAPKQIQKSVTGFVKELKQGFCARAAAADFADGLGRRRYV